MAAQNHKENSPLSALFSQFIHIRELSEDFQNSKLNLAEELKPRIND